MEVVAGSFRGKPYSEQIKVMRGGRLLHSNYDWKSSRIGILGGKVVTHFGVYDYSMRVGGARLRVAGVGMVATLPRYRKRGFMAKTVREGLAAMEEGGYELTFLSGIKGFYGRFGYVRCWQNRTYKVDVEELLERGSVPKSVRGYNAYNRKELCRLYNRENSRLTGTVVRPTFRRCKLPGFYGGALWRNSQGKARGYMVYQAGEECLRVVDWAGDPIALMAVAGRAARRLRFKQVHFVFAHQGSRLAVELRRGNCTVETHYTQNRGPMATVLDLRGSLLKLTGELERRLAASPLKKWKGALILASDRQSAALRVRAGAIRVLEEVPKSPHRIRGGRHLVQLLLGTDEPEETTAAAGMRVSGDARELLPVLFPAQEPQISLADQP